MQGARAHACATPPDDGTSEPCRECKASHSRTGDRRHLAGDGPPSFTKSQERATEGPSVFPAGGTAGDSDLGPVRASHEVLEAILTQMEHVAA